MTFAFVVFRLPYFVELVGKFLSIVQSALSGLSNSEKEEIALYLKPEVCGLAILQLCGRLPGL